MNDPAAASSSSSLSPEEATTQQDEGNPEFRSDPAAYRKVKQLAKGGGGTVYECVETSSGRRVAVKKCVPLEECAGLNPSALREIRLLQELCHPNIIPLLDVFVKKGSNLYLVFELMHEDLERVIRNKAVLIQPADVRGFLKQILDAVCYLKSKWVMHRDLKPANCLLKDTGELKLTDFGLARVFGSPRRRYTTEVQTRWYRAPELIFGAHDYTASADVWSIGCIFAELLRRAPLWPGNNEIEMIAMMSALLGTPCEDNWKGVTSLPHYVEFEKVKSRNLNDVIPSLASDPFAHNLLSKMLTYDPTRRITPELALEHSYFREGKISSPAELKRLLSHRSSSAASS